MNLKKSFFIKFVKENYQNCNDVYLLLLFIIYKQLDSQGTLKDNIRSYITDTLLQDIDIPSKSLAIKALSLFNENTTTYSNNTSLSKLKSLQIKNFGGFGEYDSNDKGLQINFAKYKNIFFGPNGGGKSSFCEALEYKLTDEIKEAKRRKFTQINQYVKNVHTNKRPEIILEFLNKDIDSEALSDNQKKEYKQAFIEKNRLQEFALFGSKDTNADSQDVLGFLIGLEDLDDLVDELVKPNTFSNYKDSFLKNIATKKQSELDININATKKQLEELDSELINIQQKYKKEDLDESFLNDKVNNIQEEYDSLLSQYNLLESGNIKFQEAKKFTQELFSLLQENKEIQDRLTEKSSKINFKALYDAILNLTSEQLENCPACDTPLHKVNRDPFEKANDEKESLSELSKLQEKHNSFTGKILTISKQNELILKDILSKSNILKPENEDDIKSYLENFFNSTNDKDKIKNLTFLFACNNDAFISKYLDLLKDNPASDKKKEFGLNINKLKDEQAIVKTELENLKKLTVKKEKLEKELAQTNESKSKIDQNAIKEIKHNDLVSELITQYKTFYSDLLAFQKRVQEEKLKQIEKEVLYYYNKINNHDTEFEKIEKIKFELNQNNNRITTKVKIKTLDNNAYTDAFAKLSEGHLRSLGLSIMLANAELSKLPFIIFDDVVNAIDSEHRANIIDLLVNSEKLFLKDLQIIVTTHDRLFWERFTNECDKVSSTSTNSGILNYTDNRTGIVFTPYNISFKSRINQALQNYDIRHALLYSRIWFESITKQWCQEEKKKFEGAFRTGKLITTLEPRIKDMYDALRDEYPNNAHLETIISDINFKGINQEHHSFDEYNYNFTHARTSNEIKTIYEAVCGLYDDMEYVKKAKEAVKTASNRCKGSQKNLNKNYFKCSDPITKQKLVTKHIEFIEIFEKVVQRLSDIGLNQKKVKEMLTDEEMKKFKSSKASLIHIKLITPLTRKNEHLV